MDRPSPRGSRGAAVQGLGTFASGPIRAGEVITIWGGVLFTDAEIKAGRARPHSVAAVDDGLYLATLLDEPASPDDYMNPSCDPNVWMEDEVTLTALRDVAADEELTADYAQWSTDADWALTPCMCGSKMCRITVTGSDWRLPELQSRYGGHFSPFINSRIQGLTQMNR